MSTPWPPHSSARRKINACTVVPYDVSAWRERARAAGPDPQRAYAVAREAAQRRQLLEFGYRLYAVDDGEITGASFVRIERGAHVVVGRHEACDLTIRSDAAISLRHVLVRATGLDDGFPQLTVLDLDSGTGFELSDESRHHAVVATGPIVLRLGATSLVALPLDAPLPERLDAPVIAHSDERLHRVRPRPLDAPRAPSGRAPTLTSVPRPLSLASFGSPEWSADVPAFELAIESREHRAAVRVSERDLGHGILLGRDDRCADAGLRAVLNAGISRVHALLIRERDGVMLYDVASTNGMSSESDRSRRVRSVALSDAGTTAFLWGGGRTTALSWRALPR